VDSKKIKVLFRNNLITPPLYSVFAFSDNDIWFSSGVPIHGDGENWTQYHLFDMGILNQNDGSLKKIWGSNSNDIYFVGNKGTIVHRINGQWTKIESGTELNLRDIWGNEGIIYISGYSIDHSKSILLKLDDKNVTTEWQNYNISGTPPYGNLIFSLYSSNNNLYIASTDGIFKDKLNIRFPTQRLFFVPRWVYKITGTGSNNLFTAGDRSNIWHYNGMTAREIYLDISVLSPLYSATAKANIIAAVGTRVEDVIYHQAIIIIGKII